ncbi:GNAT family N-acetyltransferase [Rhizobium leguminosarum bv. trifolii]|uniref:GNAT family N-acetyltransferase n=1 Tax=Rhizobium ruizarguesonis TaxID=2081791 RepID=UPI0003FF865A|nr:GNAT family N-acetyltransferase [Rhizobium ruizarguesonis]MBY5807445.1 GNAT family N-acetyltransferase [Rhizobium leguminosarum]NKL14055.1 GNAT family N-acetyltransferase [Rhizobium leguminosarum bv. viciae]QIO43452.1 GNAT family N-acetyltransferase [Rhizobium leguminosarum bv. trifolii]MBY5847559.1 GNAT family N-acetyltransferase [Rhizobium leguminosarum]MBY5896098.1 GNAT family N-acetyltransferase [Rhizobium leguminosarum]
MMVETVILSVPVFSTLCNEAFRLRRAVFVHEQKVPEAEEFDADDLSAHHLVAVTAGEVSGTLRVIYAEEHVKIGRVAVAGQWRGRGIAADMIGRAMELHRDARGNRFYLTAQADKLPLYERFGFVAYGAEFLDGGMPHLAMKNY